MQPDRGKPKKPPHYQDSAKLPLKGLRDGLLEVDPRALAKKRPGKKAPGHLYNRSVENLSIYAWLFKRFPLGQKPWNCLQVEPDKPPPYTTCLRLIPLSGHEEPFAKCAQWLLSDPSRKARFICTNTETDKWKLGKNHSNHYIRDLIRFGCIEDGSIVLPLRESASRTCSLKGHWGLAREFWEDMSEPFYLACSFGTARIPETNKWQVDLTTLPCHLELIKSTGVLPVFFSAVAHQASEIENSPTPEDERLQEAAIQQFAEALGIQDRHGLSLVKTLADKYHLDILEAIQSIASLEEIHEILERLPEPLRELLRQNLKYSDSPGERFVRLLLVIGLWKYDSRGGFRNDRRI
jgi:hypothetical protein